jgi:hypothetical protein
MRTLLWTAWPEDDWDWVNRTAPVTKSPSPLKPMLPMINPNVVSPAPGLLPSGDAGVGVTKSTAVGVNRGTGVAVVGRDVGVLSGLEEAVGVGVTLGAGVATGGSGSTRCPYP